MNGEQLLFKVRRKFLTQREVSSKALLFTLSLLVILTIATLRAQYHHNVHASNLSWKQFVYNGPNASRHYLVYTPQNYHFRTKVPLILMLHGYIQTVNDLANYATI